MVVQRRLIVAVFNERSSAESAIEQLYSAGVSSDRISYSGIRAGTTGGSFVESIKNLFGGTHTHTPTDVMQDLSNMGLPEDEAQYYAREYAAGRTIVTVHPDEQSQNVLAILQSSGGYHFHSPEGTGPAAQPSTGARVRDNPPHYTQPQTDEQMAGYDVDQIPVEGRQATTVSNSSYNQNLNRPDYSEQPVPPPTTPETSNVYKQDVNAPDYSTTPSVNIPPQPTENYGQADTLRQGGTYKQNINQPDYSNRQGYNEPGPAIPQDNVRQADSAYSNQQQPQEFTTPAYPTGGGSQGATQIPREEGATDANEQITPPTHPDGPAGPYSQGIKGTVETPNVSDEQYNRDINRTSEPPPNLNYKRERNENPHQENI